MTLDSVLVILRAIIDISLVWMVIYFILKNIKNNVKMILLFKGVFVVLIVKILSDTLNLTTIGLLLEYVIMWGPLALIIIFQPEIRSILEHIGRKQLLGRHKVLTLDEREKLVYEVMSAVDYLRKSRIGALIVLEKDIKLTEIIDSGVMINSEISPQLLVNIFVPNTPLHDGAVVIRANRITAAACILPLASDQDIAKELGTRHRAALGISKESDSVAIVVSEETGKISLARNGVLLVDIKEETLKQILIKDFAEKYNTKQNKVKKITQKIKRKK